MRVFGQEIVRNLEDGGAGGAGGGSGGGTAANAGAASGGAGDSLAAAAAARGQPPAAAPAASAPAAVAAPAAAAPAAAPAAPAAAEAYFPEGLDAALKGATERETLDKIAKHFAGLPKPPETPEAYAFKPDEKLVPFIGQDAADSKVLGMARVAAHKLGLAQPQFEGFINTFYGEMLQAGLLQPPVDIDAQFKALGGTEGSPAEQMKKGEQRVLALVDTIKGFAGRKEISDAQAQRLIDRFGDADTVIALETLLSRIPQAKGPQGGDAGGAAQSDTQSAALARLYPSMVPKVA